MREQEDSPTPVSGWVVVDLFCGIGGLTHGLRLAGFDDTAVTGTTPTNFDTHDDVVEDIASKRRRGEGVAALGSDPDHGRRPDASLGLRYSDSGGPRLSQEAGRWRGTRGVLRGGRCPEG